MREVGRLLKYSVITQHFAYILRFSALQTRELLTHQVKMLLTEKKHYTRREEQPLPLPKPSKIIVDCLFCQQLVDSGLGTKRKSMRQGRGACAASWSSGKTAAATAKARRCRAAWTARSARARSKPSFLVLGFGIVPDATAKAAFFFGHLFCGF